LRHFAADPAFNRKVVSQISRKLDEARSLLLLRSQHDAASRLAGLLLNLDRRRLGPAPAGVAVTKADLGQMIATAQETVFRLLTKFERGGLLKREDRRILLLDRPGLAAVAARPSNTGLPACIERCPLATEKNAGCHGSRRFPFQGPVPEP